VSSGCALMKRNEYYVSKIHTAGHQKIGLTHHSFIPQRILPPEENKIITQIYIEN
jgi:hypothetical protein